jgi:hypothetical protein
MGSADERSRVLDALLIERNRNVINYTNHGLSRPTQAQYNIPGKHGLTLQSTVNYTWDTGDRVNQAWTRSRERSLVSTTASIG